MTTDLQRSEVVTPRLIAFYLPQFHPTAENDQWWGKGYTEWSNTTSARPLFRGHYQPRLPSELGFYDLRVAESRHAQAQLATEYGIHGFCYYHYWFMGKRLLARPFNEVLDSGEPDFPFCLCWANESWSRVWIGKEYSPLIHQKYSDEDDVEHARWLTRALADRRAIRVNGRPMLLIYRGTGLPNPKKTIETFKRIAESEGIPEPWIVGVDAHGAGRDYRTLGFDATLGFEPQLSVYADLMKDGLFWARFKRNVKRGIFSAKLRLYNDRDARARMAAINRPHPYYPCRYVSWDNSPRRGDKGIVFVDGSPETFQRALMDAIDLVKDRDADNQIVFVNAWNEWGEGNVLEPDLRHGRQYLEAVSRSLRFRQGTASTLST